MVLLDRGGPRDCYWAALLFAGAAITDFLDGYLARKRGLVSVLGKFLDPLADKLIVMATLVWLVPMGRIAPWVVVLLLARDIAITNNQRVNQLHELTKGAAVARLLDSPFGRRLERDLPWLHVLRDPGHVSVRAGGEVIAGFSAVIRDNLIRLDGLPLVLRLADMPALAADARVRVEIVRIDLLAATLECRFGGALGPS